MPEWNAASVIWLTAISLLTGTTLLVIVRRRTFSMQHIWDDVSTLLEKGEMKEVGEPHLVVLAGEFLQALRTDEGRAISYSEPTLNIWITVSNQGTGPAQDIRGQIGQGQLAYWMTSGRIDLPENGTEEQIVLHSVFVPSLGPDRVNWVTMPLRLEYRDAIGVEWFTQVGLKLKIVRSSATHGCSCWWVELLEPQRHGRLADAAAREEMRSAFWYGQEGDIGRGKPLELAPAD